VDKEIEMKIAKARVVELMAFNLLIIGLQKDFDIGILAMQSSLIATLPEEDANGKIELSEKTEELLVATAEAWENYIMNSAKEIMLAKCSTSTVMQ
jgi:hypothetical protein